MPNLIRTAAGRCAAIAVFAALLLPLHSSGAGSGEPAAAQAPATATAAVVQYQQGVALSARAALPDSTLMAFPNGRKISLGRLREIDAAVRKARARPREALPQALRIKPAATGIAVNDADQLAAALERKDTDTLQLPDGRTLTVAMLKFLLPGIEQRTGRKLAARGDLGGKAVPVNAQSDLKAILQLPDSTVLEAPDGSRTTVGDIRKVLAAEAHKRRAAGSTGRQSPSTLPAGR